MAIYSIVVPLEWGVNEPVHRTQAFFLASGEYSCTCQMLAVS